MDLSTVILKILFLIIYSKLMAFGFVSQEERKCKYLRVDRMLKIRCFDMNLKEVPQYLKTSVEVLDLSFNRIKKLKRNSFQQYKKIQFLLLYENMIQSVEPGTFQHLTSLQEIDLSNNALMTIPMEIFQMPSLRNLYVDSNDLINLERDLETLETPIQAPLEYINIADCGLRDLPDFGILPKLWHINASMNPLTELHMAKFANMCNLKSIDLFRSSLSQCACQQVNNHFRYVGAKTKYVPVCSGQVDASLCPLPYNLTVFSKTFETCKSTASLQEARSKWISIGGCTIGGLLVLMLVFCCIKRSQRKRTKQQRLQQSRKNLVISPKNAINNKTENKLLDCDNV